MARSTRARPWTDVPPQHGRRYVVTGASSGVGLATAQILTSRGATVVLAVRDAAEGERAAMTMPGPGRAEVVRLDLADLSSVHRFAATVGDVDVLVNHAAIQGVPFSRSVDGFELHLATNHLGHFALTNLLLPRISDRVVVIGSRAHRSGVIDLDDLDWGRRGYRPSRAYAASTLAALLFLAELHRRLGAAGSAVRATGAHPGSTVAMPTWRSALTSVYAATTDVPGNTYVGPSGRLELSGWPTTASRSRTASDPELARRVWAASEEMTGVSFPGLPTTGR